MMKGWRCITMHCDAWPLCGGGSSARCNSYAFRRDVNAWPAGELCSTAAAGQSTLQSRLDTDGVCAAHASGIFMLPDVASLHDSAGSLSGPPPGPLRSACVLAFVHVRACIVHNGCRLAPVSTGLFTPHANPSQVSFVTIARQPSFASKASFAGDLKFRLIHANGRPIAFGNDGLGVVAQHCKARQVFKFSASSCRKVSRRQDRFITRSYTQRPR